MDEYPSVIQWHIKPAGPLIAVITGPGDSSATRKEPFYFTLLAQLSQGSPEIFFTFLPFWKCLLENLEEIFGNYAAAKSISTYPLLPGRPYREGDPICDRYQIQLNERGTFICVSDGCNWGEKPRRAARLVNKNIRAYVNKYMCKQRTIRGAVEVLLAAVAEGHLSVFDGREETWISGGTTVTAGVILEVCYV
jgi:hypothetical protein